MKKWKIQVSTMIKNNLETKASNFPLLQIIKIYAFKNENVDLCFPIKILNASRISKSKLVGVQTLKKEFSTF